MSLTGKTRKLREAFTRTVATFTLFVVSALMPQEAIAEIPPQGAVRKPLLTVSGADSRIVTPSYRRITSAKQWESLWQQHMGPPGNKTAPPRVNFDDSMVIAIFSGSAIANGGVSLLGVTEKPDKIVLRYSNRYKQIGMPTPEELRNPRGAFGLFVLPRSAKPVVLEESVRDRIGAEPKIKRRGQLPAA